LASSSGLDFSAVGQSAVSLLFPEGRRPDVADLRALGTRTSEFTVSHVSDTTAADGADGTWLEILASGLTFDLTGLAPGTADPLPQRSQAPGLGNISGAGLEAITLRPGPHISGGAGMLPVVRTLASMGAVLAGLDGVAAVCWRAAGCWSAPTLYRDGVTRWIEGGVFPGLILTSLRTTAQGGLESQGMALFTGQELHLEPVLVGNGAEGAKLAIRLIDYLVVHGRVSAKDRILGPDGEPLTLEPASDGSRVNVGRG